jgi:predicted amidohydrolase
MREVRIASIQPRDQFNIFSDTSPERARADELKQQNLDLAERLLTRAGTLGCDIVCYPECIEGIGCHLFRADISLFLDMVEEIPGPISDRMSEIASKYRMHIIYTQYERVGNTIYNAGVLLGRKGEILGKYYKIHLPAIERWTVTRGDSFPVFPTEFGNVGILICYDFAFPEISRCLALSGAELLFCPTMGVGTRGACEGNGLIQVQARAMETFLPITISTCRKDSMIVNNDGSVLALARPYTEDVITAVIDLDARYEDHSDWEMITGLTDVRARLLQERLPEVYRPILDPHPPVMEQLRDKPLRPAPTERGPFFEERRAWWTQRGG